MIYVLSGWRQIFELLKANCGRSLTEIGSLVFPNASDSLSENNRLSPCLDFFSELKELVLWHFKRSHRVSQTVCHATAAIILGNVSDRMSDREAKHARSRVDFTSRKMSRP